jgi:hypothetical protein
MKKSFLFAGILSVMLVLLSSCTDEWRRGRNSNEWTSSDPGSIPYNIRMKELKSGNLVPNFSFEEGTTTDDSLTKPVIRKWVIIGEGVSYIGNSKDSVFTPFGARSVRIMKSTSNETDSMGSGILSDFIPVLPGNYNFSFQLKAHNIKPQNERRGCRLYDAINIRIEFYDDRHNRLSPEMYYPYTGTYLDNSFKGYSFSNFFTLDNLDWTEIIGRTYNYPWSEGDMPDGCRYIRLFIGLRGTGTLWIDDINLSFSKWNFTPLERTGWYKDSAYSITDLILPTPRHIRFRQNIPLIAAGKENVMYPAVILDTEQSPSNIHTLNYLSEELYNSLIINYPDCSIKSFTKPQQGELNDASVIFLLTDYSSLDTGSFSSIMPGFSSREQGYIISDTLISGKKVIILAGADEAGLFYAATTIVRLLDNKTGVYRHCHLIDFPEYTGRGFQLSPWDSLHPVEKDLELLDYLTFWRFNKAYLPYYQNGNAKYWYKSNPVLQEGTTSIADYVREKGTLQFGVMFNPYNHFEYEMNVADIPDSLKKVWLHNEKGMEMIKSLLKPAFDQGALFLMLLADDFVPHRDDYRKLYDLWDEEDMRMHVNLQNAQAYMVNWLYQWLQASYGKIRFEFCPPWYLNEFIDKSRGRAEAYFRDMKLMIPADVQIIWTGNTVRSLSFDKADIKRYADLCGREPMLWDNTLYARSLEGIYGGYPSMYPGKIKLCNLFEPWDVIIPDDYAASSPHFYSNGYPNTEIYKIKYATLADYQWNPAAYNPDRSLWKVLVIMFGKETAWELMIFNQKYYLVLENIILIEKESKENKSLVKSTQIALSELDAILKNLSSALNKQNPELFEELGALTQQLHQRISVALKKTNQQQSGKEQI